MIIFQEKYARSGSIWPTSAPARPSCCGSPVRLSCAECQERTLAGGRVTGECLLDARWDATGVWSGGTYLHRVAADLRDSPLGGKQVEDGPDKDGVIANRNGAPSDPRLQMVSSGMRVGTTVLATCGTQADDVAELDDVIRVALGARFEAGHTRLGHRSWALARRRPLHTGLATTATLGAIA